MNRLLLGYVLFSVGALSFLSFVNAEEYTVTIPFDSHGASCEFDEIAVEYHCVWQGQSETITGEDIEELKNSIHDGIIDGQIAELNANTLEEIANKPLTANEKLIEKLTIKLDSGKAEAKDAVLLHLLEELDECQQGLGNSEAIQTKRTFVISNYVYGSQNNVPIKGQMGELLMAIQECYAQQKLENKILTVRYSNMAHGDMDFQYDHRSTYEGMSAIEFDKYTTTSNQIDLSMICDNHQFSNQHKAQMGCEVLYDGKTAEQIKRENEVRFGTEGSIGYDSELLDNYHQFMYSYGNVFATPLDKQLQEDIAKPIAKELIEDNLFYQNKIKRD